jgi:nitroreductase
MNLTNDNIKKAIIRSQHCQRNFDLTSSIPESDIEVLLHAAQNCPSKQNKAYYKLHVLTDRDMIEKVHELTTGTVVHGEDGGYVPSTNSQVLANILFVFEPLDMDDVSEGTREKWKNSDHGNIKTFYRDQDTALGIASGYVNLTASILGYSTGCCQCADMEAIQEVMGLKNAPMMLQGIGIKDPTRNRRLHEKTGLMFTTNKKEEIEVIRS